MENPNTRTRAGGQGAPLGRPERHRFLLGLLLAAVIPVAAVSNGGEAGAASSPQAPGGRAITALPGRIYLTKTTAGDDQSVYVLAQGHERRVTDPGDYCCVLRVSPDRRRLLVFPTADQPPPLAGASIRTDGTGPRRVGSADPTLNLIPATWSPDGTRVAYLGWDDGDASRRGLYTSRVDGTDLRRVTVRPGDLDDVPLDYSPDGRQLVFYRSAHPDPDPHTDGALWVVNVDGSHPHPITDASVHPADSARWSPDDARIVFANERTSALGAVWTVAPDGTCLTALFHGPATRFPITPVWSPDGRSILFALDPTNDAFSHPDNALWTMTADGSHRRLVDATPDFKSQLDWVSAGPTPEKETP